MKISNNPPQHLSNLEVLNHFVKLQAENAHLQELQRNHKLRQAAKDRIKYPLKEDRDKEFEDPPEEVGGEEDAERRGIPGDLFWVQDQVLKYLCSDHNSASRQTEEGVASLADSLQDFGLTKGEVLQIVNLAPTELVELYCEKVPEDRFGESTSDRLDEIAQQVKATLLEYPPESLYPFLPAREDEEVEGGEDGAGGVDDAEYEAAMMEQEFVHEADWGAGHEDGVGEEKENPLDE